VAHQTLLFKQVFHSEELPLKTRCYLFLIPWRCGGILAQKFNKITGVEPCTNVS
jgi:hypothetical protein